MLRRKRKLREQRRDLRSQAKTLTVWANPTVVYIDSISVVTPTLSFALDAASSVSMIPTSADVAGQVLWLDNDPADTTATGVTLTWQATCP